jgi:formate dehydrogenase
VLPESLADIPLDFGTLEPHGSFVGSHAVVVLSDKDDMKAVALNLMKFFEDESCGQCTPCRVGTEKAVKLMEQGPWNETLLNELSTAMRDASICGLGQAAPNPLQSVMKHFPDDLKKPLKGW